MAGTMEYLAGLPFIGGFFGGAATASRVSADIAQGLADMMKGASQSLFNEMQAAGNRVNEGITDFQTGVKALSVSMDTEKNYGVSGESEVDRIQAILNNAESATNKAGDTYIFTMQSDLDRLLDMAGETG